MLIRLRDGLRLHARDRGGGAPVIALHGFAGPSDAWEAGLGRLSASRRVVAVDLLGHGASDGATVAGRYAMSQMVADVLEVADTLDLGRVALLGYSMGGRVALAVARQVPERVVALVLESTSPGLQAESERVTRREADDALASQIETRGVEWFADHWTDLPLFETRGRLDPTALASVHRRLLANRPAHLGACLRGLGVGSQAPYWDDLARLVMPTLLLAGEDDAKFAQIARAMHERLPTAELTLVPQAGHTIHLEQPAPWLARIETFLDRHVPAG